jgi:hypothetical protein
MGRLREKGFDDRRAVSNGFVCAAAGTGCQPYAAGEVLTT